MFSKAIFLQYLQCPKLAWISYHIPKKLPPLDSSAEYRIKEGKVVESYAHQLFPNALLIDHSRPFEDVISQSNDAINRSSLPIFNTILRAHDFIAEVDILLPVEDEFDLYEIKPSTIAKPDDIPDIAFLKYVAEQRGLRIRKCFLVLLNGSYARKREIEPEHLFKTGNVSEGVQEYGQLHDINAQVERALLACHQNTCPDTKIGVQCSNDCQMRNICWKKVDAVKNNIFNLYRLPRKMMFEWYEHGIIKKTEIPKKYLLNERQKIQIQTETSGKIHVNKDAVREFCNQLTYPLYFLDFETFSCAIPLIDDSKPFETIPFQYSLHVIEKALNNTPKHFSWIWNREAENDPREVLLHRLQSRLGNNGSIIAYNAVFEMTVLKQAAKICPAYEKWLDGILKRFIDMLMPFRNFAVYHPDQKGSCSLKAVLPALTGHSYDRLIIGDGEQASSEYLKIARGATKGADKQAILENLEIYCGQDSMAMIEILRKMKTLS